MTGSDFDRDTAVEPAGPGHYTGTVTDRWSALAGGPNGGYLLGICLRALRAEIPDSHPDPLVVSGYFLRPGTVGPAELDTEVIRTGRRIATGEARLSQDSRCAVLAVANFTDLGALRGRTTVLGEPPKLPPPEHCLDLTGGQSLPGLTIVDRYQYRFPERPGWTVGRPSREPRMEFWMRFSDGRDADPLSLAPMVDAAAPAVLELGEFSSSTVELTVHVRARPAPGWLACRVVTRYVIDGYHEEDFEIWDSAGALVAQGRQLAILLSEPPGT
ncbi:MAG TPA: thioesterase family protein [Micromonosporaceae bacterium]